MNKDKVDLTSVEQERLLTVVREEGESAHLSDDELAAHVMHLETPEERNKVLQHLSQCEECRSVAGELQVATDKWRGPAGNQRFNDMLEQTREQALTSLDEGGLKPTIVFDAASDFSFPLVVPYALNRPMAASFKTERAPYRCETADQLTAVSLVEEEFGDLCIYVDSRVPGLQGREIVVTVKSRQLTKDSPQWRRVLSQIDSDQVGAKLIITDSERRALPEAQALIIQLKD